MASAYLTRTVTASTATSYTVSFWVKINDVGNTSSPYFWSIGSSAGNGLYYDSDNKIKFFKQSTTEYLTIYDGALRDPSGWTHVVWSVNAGTGTAYVNGVTGNSHSSIPALNDNTGTKINIHSYVTGAYNTLDCCMAHFHFIDGTAYNADTFGESDSVSGTWKPKTSPSVTYGSNGFFLKFENSGAMGTDSSGNGNNFTVSGTLTQNVDTPSNNFATFNALNNNSTLTNGNLTATTDSAQKFGSSSTLGVSSGKFYWEMKVNATYLYTGVDYDPAEALRNNDPIRSHGWCYNADGSVYNNGSGSSFGNTFTTNDIIGVALDATNSKLYFSKNGTWQNSGDPTSGATGTGAVSITANETYFAVMGDGGSSVSSGASANFGQGYFGTTAVASAGTSPSGGGIFEFDCPNGYQALCTKGINSF